MGVIKGDTRSLDNCSYGKLLDRKPGHQGYMKDSQTSWNSGGLCSVHEALDG